MQIDGAALATEPAKYGLADRFDSARAFQNRTVEWVHERSEPVAVLRAPTGGGKTATFPDLIEESQMALLVYPTNALLRQQHQRFQSNGIDVAVLDSTSLEGHGLQRTAELKQTVNQYAGSHDAVLTNPDILQAVIQNMYAGEHAMEFFDRFDAVVYDEFHFYDALAASGILLQIKVLTERQSSPRVLLASATPNEDFVDFVDDKLGLDIYSIDAEYVEDGQQFRHPVTVSRREENSLLDCRHEIAETLASELSDIDDYEEPRVVLVFNGAADSNSFHDFLEKEYPNVFPHVEKDNGFDTDDEEVDLSSSSFYVLNTTSKGEVGLDYDIRTLLMETPYPRSAADFLQRFGRAGRQSPASVEVFGLGQGPWGDDVSFPAFVEQIYDGLGTYADSGQRTMPLELLADLVALRAAHAFRDRVNQYGWLDQEIWEDLSTVERFDQWRGFLQQLDDDREAITNGIGSNGKYTSRDPETGLLQFTTECLGVFEGLRGRSLSAAIEYPRGDRKALTSYSLTRTLRHYDIDRVTDGPTFHVVPQEDDTPGTITARFEGYETQPAPFHEPTGEIESNLQQKLHREIDRAASREKLAVSPDLLHRFYRVIRIVDAVVPKRLTTSEYDIHVEKHQNSSPTVSAEHRQP
jgi:CRISPR-associated endonuclease/helicase Cas3